MNKVSAMSLKQRVSEYCNYRNIAVSKFESLAGISNGYFNNIKKDRQMRKLRIFIERSLISTQVG